MLAPHPSGAPTPPRLRGRPGGGPLGICIVGCGRFATFHARAARGLRGGVRLSFASRQASRAEAYRRRFGGVAAFGSYEAAAASPEVDALVICTPHHLHLGHARLAADHGKAILLEKPIARTLAEADAILDAARAAGVVLMVAENFHFMPALVAARAWLRAGTIGSVRQVLISARGHREPGGWRVRRADMGGGHLIDGGIHYVHVLRDWGGPVARVVGASPPNLFPGSEGEETIFLLVHFQGGAVGVLANSVSAPGLPSWQWAMATGTAGSMGLDTRGRLLWVRGREGTRVRLFLRDRRGLRSQLGEFAAAVRTGRPPALLPGSTREDLAVVLAAYRSIETGAPVTLEPPS
jgi:predicted dehydrogenase